MIGGPLARSGISFASVRLISLFTHTRFKAVITTMMEMAITAAVLIRFISETSMDGRSFDIGAGVQMLKTLWHGAPPELQICVRLSSNIRSSRHVMGALCCETATSISGAIAFGVQAFIFRCGRTHIFRRDHQELSCGTSLQGHLAKYLDTKNSSPSHPLSHVPMIDATGAVTPSRPSIG
jgi:hypothetical protein